MQYYTSIKANSLQEQQFAFILAEEQNNVLTITLNRPEKKNALHPHMANELAWVMAYATQTPSIWVIVIQAAGDIFCSGADLKAFMGDVGTFESSIPDPGKTVLIGELFNKVHKPVISKVHGDVFAGGFFFLAGSTYVVANTAAKLGLPEVKRGLFPFQVMASLLRVMPARKVLDWCIRGYTLPVEEAADIGLVTHAVPHDLLDTTIDKIIEEIKENSPSAIKLGLEAFDHINPSENNHQYLMEMLQKAVMSKDGQEGLRAFREKRKPEWTGM